jgi:hypothetical protein
LYVIVNVFYILLKLVLKIAKIVKKMLNLAKDECYFYVVERNFFHFEYASS